MKFNNKTYDVLKILVERVLPALLTFAGVVMTTLQFEYTNVVLTIGTAFITCLGTCLGISSSAYYAEHEESEEDS